MRFWILLGCLLGNLTLYSAKTDSIKVERWLHEAATLPKDSCRTLYFATKMLGVSYVAGTLDQNKQEQLVIHLDKVDCTTFVEVVLALTLTDKQGKRDFSSFKEALQLLRYRAGKLEDYSSRLHYFSDWIKDNERKGIVRENTAESLCSSSMILSLDFMSSHVDSYLPMKNDPLLVQKILEQENNWKKVPVKYIPKEQLKASSKQLKIKNGDILAITTSIKGLDIVHVGFACWQGGQLHMLHASSIAQKVILDEQTLYDYSKNKKAHTGVRAISFVYE